MAINLPPSLPKEKHHSICGPMPYGSPLSMISGLCFVTIAAIAAIGLIGKMSPLVMGWSLTGASGVLATVAILGVMNELKNKNNDEDRLRLDLRKDFVYPLAKILTPIILGILAVLTATGMLSSTALGWCVYCPVILALTLPLVIVPVIYCEDYCEKAVH